MSDSNILPKKMVLIEDDFEFPAVQRGAEKSRHFAPNQRQEPYEPKDMMTGCDDFERKTADDLFEALRRRRNNVCQ